MIDRLEMIRARALEAITLASSVQELDKLRSKFIGRKGELTLVLRGLGAMPPAERPKVGRLANIIKGELEEAISKKKDSLGYSETISKISGLDPTLPGRRRNMARLHPVTQVMDEVTSIFRCMGFSVVVGPEIELDFYNFEALNIPADHPARDMQDTFYINEKVLLRTHTSPIQVRTMERCSPPLRIIAPGKVYRCDSDVTHTPMFHQVEGLMVDRDVTFSGLKGLLIYFLREVFDRDTPVRFRPSFFPFTEPSAEVDIQCVMCRGKGCRICSHTGWLEVLGAGMVHPNVFRKVGYDTEEFTGFAFGLGIERIAMLKYGIDDIRLFYENDIRFLNQF
ncbi:MAG: phenylalanine--tRNA ligase subunit alpha [Dissulfurimicrobium sp.]|uniref:phenylalanine--tRNA ligase subunit alpha n=1 Tax=Dissulfurimicrobium sp. TaxID=2022436 RepID=UPI00404AB297